MKNVATIQDNEILQAGATYYSKNLKSKLQDDILLDYNKGVRTASIDIKPSNLFNENQALVKNWQNGEMIEVNDIIKILNENGTGYLTDFDGNEICFRVVDREVEYNGEVSVKFKLQEIVGEREVE